MNDLISNIKTKVFTLRGVQVMLDTDLADLYGVKAIRLREQVKRNVERFPDDFRFQLTEDEVNFMLSQNAIPSKKQLGGNLPYAFTEQGVSMLSGVLRSKTAIQASINIITAFVAMRKFISQNASVFNRLDNIEKKQVSFEIKTDTRFEKIFEALETKEQKQGIFYDGQIFDAYKFVCSLVRKATKEIILIDNYIDESVLILFSKKTKGVSVNIYTKNISKQLNLDVEKFNLQYGNLFVKEFNISHDRFIIIDSKEIYHIGASLKDLGKKWFAFSKFESDALNMLKKLS